MSDEVGELRREIEMLRSQNARLMAGLDAIERRISADSAPVVSPELVERRKALRMIGGIAAAGAGVAAVGLSGAQPAAADVPPPLVEGLNVPVTPYVVNAALTAGVLQVNNTGDAPAVTAQTSASGSTALTARGVDTGISADAVGVGVAGAGLIGVKAMGAGLALGSGIGLQASGPQANARFPLSGTEPWTKRLGPAQSPIQFDGGELVVDEDGGWWVCVKPGSTVDSWRMLASPDSVGSFVPIVPQRFYDSRISGNVLKADQERVVDLPASLPEGVRAVHVNVTVCNTVGAGYLAVFPSDTLWPGTSAVHWFTDNQNVANAITVKTDGKHLTLRAGTNATQIVLDLYGYYR